MLRIRLRRTGARHQPSYRVVVADSRAARNGAFVDQLGHYNPRTDPPTVSIDEYRALEWIRKGAQPSDSVQQLLRTLRTYERAEAGEITEGGGEESDNGDDDANGEGGDE